MQLNIHLYREAFIHSYRISISREVYINLHRHHTMNPNIFRLYDIRGKYPSQINEKEVFDIALRLGEILPKKGTIVIGRDARLSSPSLSTALEHGLCAADFKVVNVGMITTPMLDFAVKRLKADGGVMVTASHNPKYDNGLGVVDSSGLFVGGNEIFSKISKKNLKIKADIKKLENPEKCHPARKNINSEYARYLSSFIDTSKKLKVVIDCSNGSAGPIVKSIKFPQNIEAVIINSSPDGNFPAHGPDPTQKTAQRAISRAVLKNKADIGVVFDGDCDRALFADGRGNIIRPEYIWRMLAIKENKPSVVFTVLCRYTMDLIKKSSDDFKNFRFVESKVGHLFMKKICRKEKAVIGVESSMHYYFPEDNFSGSAILAMIKVLNAVSLLPYRFFELSQMLPKVFIYPETNIKFNRKNLSQAYLKTKKIFFKKAQKIYFLDGISAYGSDWWFNVRPSNTEDLVRINIESENKNKLEEIKNQILKIF